MSTSRKGGFWIMYCPRYVHVGWKERSRPRGAYYCRLRGQPVIWRKYWIIICFCAGCNPLTKKLHCCKIIGQRRKPSLAIFFKIFAIYARDVDYLSLFFRQLRNIREKWSSRLWDSRKQIFYTCVNSKLLTRDARENIRILFREEFLFVYYACM